jgi:type I restriction enzyme S subunit
MEAIGEDGSVSLGRTRPVHEVRNGYSYFEDGDVVFAKVTPCFENGKTAVLRGLQAGAGFGTTEFTVLRAMRHHSARFLGYVVQSERFRQPAIAAMTGAGGLKRVPEQFTRDFEFASPDKQEQERIADFLDERMARLAALIAEKRRLIERLREYERARADLLFRSRSSTYGTVKLKYRVPAITVGIVVTPAKYYVDSGVPCLRSLNVVAGGIQTSEMVFISQEANSLHEKSVLRAGDIVVVRSGKPGSTAVIPQEFDGANCVDLVIVRRGERLEPAWLCEYLNSPPALEQVVDSSDGAIQQHFNVSSAKELRIPDVPLPVQISDLEALRRDREATSKLAIHAEEHIRRLIEYRSSLITYALSGEFCVAEAVAA